MSDSAIELTIDDIQKRIPHRPPMLLIDRVEALVPDSSAVGIKMVKSSHSILFLNGAVTIKQQPDLPEWLLLPWQHHQPASGTRQSENSVLLILPSWQGRLA